MGRGGNGSFYSGSIPHNSMLNPMFHGDGSLFHREVVKQNTEKTCLFCRASETSFPAGAVTMT